MNVGRSHLRQQPVPAPPSEFWRGPARQRWLVEELEELPVRALLRLRETGRPSAVYPGTGRIQFPADADRRTAPIIRTEAVRHRLADRPSPTPRLYVLCPRCSTRRTSLFLLQDAIGCRGCLRLRYLSQGKGQWNRTVLHTVEARLRALAARPGPNGRQYRAWARRHQRLSRAWSAWLIRIARQLQASGLVEKKVAR